MARKRQRVELEYLLRVFPHRDNRKAGHNVVISIETLKEFVSFQYEVLLEERRTDNEFSFRILGLHAPRSVMPAVGPARGIRVLGALRGTYRIRVSKPDGPENLFSFKISDTTIRLLESPEQPFVLFSTEPIPITI
ncbi:MAG: hypothetical protein HYW57_06150 [Ignavibacteriales bacterium]|nr:hypothetical protein [Ignavibacteriales bacterium]